MIQIVVQGVFAGLLAIYLFGRSVTALGASRASVFPALVPAFAILIGFIALGDVPSVAQLVGLAIVGVGFQVCAEELKLTARDRWSISPSAASASLAAP